MSNVAAESDYIFDYTTRSLILEVSLRQIHSTFQQLDAAQFHACGSATRAASLWTAVLAITCSPRLTFAEITGSASRHATHSALTPSQK